MAGSPDVCSLAGNIATGRSAFCILPADVGVLPRELCHKQLSELGLRHVLLRFLFLVVRLRVASV